MRTEIIRPGIVSHQLSFIFHVCKDEKEVLNALVGVKKEDIFEVYKTVDTETFEPIIYFAIREEGKPFIDWLKFATKLSDIYEYYLEKEDNNTC